MFKRLTYLLTTGLWVWAARVFLGSLGTDWVFDSRNPEQSRLWMFGSLEVRNYATEEMLDQPDGQRALATFNLFRSGLFESVSDVTVGAAAFVVVVVALAQGLFFGMEG
ncbi:hypothetical protein [Xanthomonas sp. NCPPB 2632]|uniref:hypothetical protein n=1 Tax=Xanthomonas sp. NCPPB 2632 TaxID=3240912 RepID=UPI003514DBAC